MTLYQQIQRLPQVLQDLIGEYNVNHRSLVRKLRDEYFSIIYQNCRICERPFRPELYCSLDYFIYQKHHIRTYWCTQRCFDIESDENAKEKYLRAIEDTLAQSEQWERE
jgi:Zn-finger protein